MGGAQLTAPACWCAGFCARVGLCTLFRQTAALHLVLGAVGTLRLDPAMRARATPDLFSAPAQPTALPLTLYAAFVLTRIGQLLFWWWLPYLAGIVSSERLVHFTQEFADADTILPLLRGGAQVVPPVAEMLLLPCLVASLVAASRALVRSPLASPVHTFLLWLGGGAAVGYVWLEGLVIGHGGSCARCKHGFSFGASHKHWSDSGALAIVTALLLPVAVAVGSANLVAVKPHDSKGDFGDGTDSDHAKRQ